MGSGLGPLRFTREALHFGGGLPCLRVPAADFFRDTVDALDSMVLPGWKVDVMAVQVSQETKLELMRAAWEKGGSDREWDLMRHSDYPYSEQDTARIMARLEETVTKSLSILKSSGHICNHW